MAKPASWKKPLALGMAALLLTTGCAGNTSDEADDAPLTVLTIGTADSGGTMYKIGSLLAQSITDTDNSIKVNLGASTGSSMNVLELSKGEIDLGLVSGDIAYAAYHGQEPFDEPMENLRAVAAVFLSTSNWIAPASTGAEYVHDLRGMRVGIGPQSSTSELSAQTVVTALGLDQANTSFVNCGLGDGAQMVEQGELDALHGFSGAPVGGLKELAQQQNCTLLKYTQEELQDILSLNPLYQAAVIPAGTYAGQTENVDTFGVKCLLCVDASMSEEQVYQLTQKIWESSGQLSARHPAMQELIYPEFLCQNLPIPLHPGAQKFYQEQNMLD